MGRYSGTQTASSSNPNVAKISYAEAVGTHVGESSAGGSTAAAHAGDDGGIPGQLAAAAAANSRRKLVVPKVENTSSSNAGAGSSNFHTYRRDRNAERKRIDDMEREHAELVADKEFKRRRAEANAACEAQTKKRAAKRRRRKENKRAARKRTKTGASQAESATHSIKIGSRVNFASMGDGAASPSGGMNCSSIARSAGIGKNSLPNNGTALQRLLEMTKSSNASPNSK